MAVLQKIRVKFGLLASIIIAIGLLLFIVDPSSVASAVQSMSSKFDVGEINGKSVSYTDFQEDIQKYTTINEMLTGGSAQNAQQQAQIRNQAWEQLVFKYLFLSKAHDAGIFVGDKELVDMTAGSNLSPMIAQNPVFLDEQGNFSPENVSFFIQQMSQDNSGRYRMYWDWLQTNIENNRYFEKYASLFTASMKDNSLMLQKAIAENNTTSDVEFVMIPFGYAKDSSVVVSDKEIKDFYNSHKDFYKQQASRDIEYVVYEVNPSDADIAATQESIVNLAPKFENAENVTNFMMKNSDKPYTDFWYKRGDFKNTSAEIEKAVWEGKSDVSGVIREGNNFYISRVLDTKNVPDSVYVRHILLQGENAEHQADSLVKVLAKGGNFSNLAAMYSLDQQAADGGEKGNIGWLTQTYNIPGFESVFTADKKKPFVLKTQYGFHVVEVVKTTELLKKKKVAVLTKEALASKETFNEVYGHANDFATMANGSYKNYKKAVDSLGVYSHPVSKMLESANNLGAIEETREVTRWAFEKKAGEVSQIMTVNNNYFVVAVVTGVHKEGYADLKEVSPYISEMLYHEKLRVKKQEEVAAQIAGMTDLQAIAEKFNTTVSTHNGVTFASMGNQQLDPAFIGAVSVAPLNEIAKPVAGSIAVYVYKVTNREVGSFFTESDAKTQQMQMSNYMTNMIIPVMMQDADVKDNRAHFY